MSVHKDYPDGCAPSAGPFFIRDGDGDKIVVSVDDGEVGIDMDVSMSFLAPSKARELAAALIECADFIDRAAMTTEDKAKDAGDGR